MVKAVKNIPQECISEKTSKQIDDDSVPVDKPYDQACRVSVASGDSTTCPSSSGDDEDDQARRLSEAARHGDRAALTQVLLSTALMFIDEKIADSPVSVPMTQTRLVDIVRSIPDCLTQLAEEHLVHVPGPLIQEIFDEVVTAILETVTTKDGAALERLPVSSKT